MRANLHRQAEQELLITLDVAEEELLLEVLWLTQASDQDELVEAKHDLELLLDSIYDESIEKLASLPDGRLKKRLQRAYDDDLLNLALRVSITSLLDSYAFQIAHGAPGSSVVMEIANLLHHALNWASELLEGQGREVTDCMKNHLHALPNHQIQEWIDIKAEARSHLQADTPEERLEAALSSVSDFSS